MMGDDCNIMRCGDGKVNGDGEYELGYDCNPKEAEEEAEGGGLLSGGFKGDGWRLVVGFGKRGTKGFEP